ncbi:MAG: hypothetical protein ACK5LO_02430 [Leucobacter sp.]
MKIICERSPRYHVEGSDCDGDWVFLSSHDSLYEAEKDMNGRESFKRFRIIDTKEDTE